MTPTRFLALSSLAGLPFAGAAAAQTLAMGMESPLRLDVLADGAEPDSPAPAGGSPLAAEPEKPWRITLAPYAWLTSMSGDLTIRGIDMDVSVSFSDLLDKSDSLVGLMGALDLEYDRFVFQFNAAYASVTFDGSRGAFSNGSVSADLEMKLGFYEMFGGYRFLDQPLESDGTGKPRHLALDGFVGCRLTTIDVDATLSASNTVTLPGGEVLNFGATAQRSGSEQWFEPFVGGRLAFDLSEHWSAFVRADVGGFGLDGADLAWQTLAFIGYTWQMEGWRLTAGGGYRVLSQDYTNGEFAWDMVTHGPLLGAAFTWTF